MNIHKESVMRLAIVKYYVSVTDGDDLNNGTSSSTPWKTVGKVNSVWNAQSFNSGDSILFKAGDVWSGANGGTLTIKESGSSGSPICVGRYSTGNKPELNGFVTMTGWTSVGSGVYYSTNTNLGTNVHEVLRNGYELDEGREPDAPGGLPSYFKFEAATLSSITDNELGASPDYTGCDVVVRVKLFVTERRRISTHSTHVLTISPNFTETPQANLGYYFTGGSSGILLLDQDGEWWYDAPNHRLYMYSSTGSAPAGTIQATATSNLIKSYNYSYVNFSDLNLKGANDTGVAVGSTSSGGSGIRLTNVKVQFARLGFYTGSHPNIYLYQDSVKNCGGKGIMVYNCNDFVIRRCFADSTNIFPSESVDYDSGGIGIYGTHVRIFHFDRHNR